MINHTRKMVMILGNALHYKKGLSKSKALKTAWAMVKQGEFSSNVVGVTFENRQEVINRLRKYSPESIKINLVWEKDNPHDANAVAIMVSVNDSKQIKVGYLPREIANLWVGLVKLEVVVAMVKQISGGQGRNLGMNLNLRLAKAVNKSTEVTILDHWRNTRAAWAMATGKIQEAVSPARATASM